MNVARRDVLIGLVSALPLGRVSAQTGPQPGWIWSGAITPRSAVVKAAFTTAEPSPPPLLVSSRLDLSDALSVVPRVIAAPSASYKGRTVLEYAVSDLTPRTEYFGGYSATSGTRVRFRTFGEGAFSFTAAFGSCAGGTRLVPLSHVSNSRVFDALEALKPDVFIHMGDFHYYNIHGPARPVEYLTGIFHRALDRVLSQERQALFYRRTPLVYMFDDHDYGPDDADGTSTTRDAARACYDTNVPHYPLPLAPKANGPIAQTFDIGRVRFLTTDDRSERLPDRNTMLGDAQEAWLLAELARAAAERAPLVVWVNPVPWITADGDNDGWGHFAAQRKRIGARITELGLASRLLMLSGDAHMLAFDDGRHNVNGGFVVAQAAPLDRFVRRKGGPYSHDPGKQVNGQFGLLRVDDTGTTLTATLEGYRHTGSGQAVQVPGVVIRVQCVGGTCSVVPTT